MKKISILLIVFTSISFGQDIVDSYSEGYYSLSFSIYNTRIMGGQSFVGNGKNISTAKFYAKKLGSPTGYCRAKVYAHQGTYGTDGVATGSPLAISDSINVETISTVYDLVTFNFPSSYSLNNGSYYVIVCEYTGGNSSNCVQIGIDSYNLAHAGNLCYYTTSWQAVNARDACFYVYGVSPTAFIPQITID